MGQSVAGYFFSFMFYVLVARVMSPDEVGKLSILMVINSVFSLTNLSIQYALQRFIPVLVEEGKLDGTSGVIRTGLTIVMSTSAIPLTIIIAMNPQISTFIFGDVAQGWPITFILLAAFVLNITSLLGSAMLGFGMFSATAVQNILNTGVSRILAVGLASIGLGLVGVAGGWLVAAAATLVFSLYALRNHLSLKRGFPSRDILAFSLPIHALNLITSVQGWADIAILYALTTNLTQTGTYYLVVSGAAILSLFYSPLSMVILPMLSAKYTREGHRGVSAMANVYTRIVAKVLLPVGFSFAALSSTAIEVVYGPGYATGAIPFAILAATSIIPALSLLIVTIIQSTGKTRPLIIIGAASAAADIAVVAVLASSLGGIAGAVGRIAFPTVSFLLGYFMVRENIKLNLLYEIGKPLVVAFCISVPLFAFDYYLTTVLGIPTKIRAPMDVMAFTILTVGFVSLTRYLTKDDFDLLRLAMPKQLGSLIDKFEQVLTRR